ncbi:MAG: hypothetical protein ABGZ53_24630 [Fuerstiella sp.]
MTRLDLLIGIETDQLLERIGWSLIHSLWQVTAVAVGALILSQMLARRNAQRRYAIYCGSLLLMLLIPLQAVVETVLFYHPAVWWVSRRIRVERENCTDDVAVATVGDRIAYAKALAAVAELCPCKATNMVAANGGDLKSRIVRILHGGDRSNRRSFGWGWLPLLAFLLSRVNADRSAVGRHRSRRRCDRQRGAVGFRG